MPLKRHEDRLLKVVYLEHGFPIDQYAQRPRALSRLVEDWNARSGRDDSSDDVRHYMLTMRKRGKWVRFDSTYEPLRCPTVHDLTAHEWAALRSIWMEINVGREQYAVNHDLRIQLAAEFFARTRHAITADLLYAAAMAMQKHWENHWPKVRAGSGMGFRDISDVG
jgi:hypothetical protein